MDFADDLLIETEIFDDPLGIEDLLVAEETEEQQNAIDMAKFFENEFLVEEEQGEIMADELSLIDEGLVTEWDSIDSDADLLGLFQPGTSDATAITESRKEVMQRRKASDVLHSLDQYVNVFSTMALQLKGQSQNDRATREMNRRLNEFYEHYNNVLPSAILSAEFYSAVNALFPENKYKNQYGNNTSLSQFIISEIKNGTGILTIVEILKAFFARGGFVDGRNQTFLLTSMNESKVLTFLNKLKSYYESESGEYERELSTRDTAQASLANNLNRFLVVSNETKERKDNVQLTYPNTIYLDDYSFVCGECGSEERYEYPFLKMVLMNTSKDDFLTILPTLEVCTNCGYYNMLPANYYEVMVRNIREEFKTDYNLNNLRDNLDKLHSEFTRYSYELPRSVILQSLPTDLKTLYQERILQADDYLESFSKAVVDMSQAVAGYKNRVASLLAAKQLDFSRIRTDNDLDLVNVEYQVSRRLAGPVYSLVARVFCASIGSDYNMMKMKAINSLLFFLEDYIPFTINPFVVVREYAANLVGLMDDEMYREITKEYQTVKDCLDEAADYFAFVPIIVASSQHRYLEQFMQDAFMRDFLNYVTDAMIIYSLREDLVDLCIVGQSAPFANTKVKLKNLLLSGQKEPLIKKFSRSFDLVMSKPITAFINTRRNWLYNRFGGSQEHKEMFRAFIDKDIYEVMRIVYGDQIDKSKKGDPRYSRLKPHLDELFPQFQGKSKLEFYYGDLFAGEDFTKYSDEGITLFYIAPREEGEDFQHYLDEIRNKRTRMKQSTLKNREWFSTQILQFFEFLKDNCLVRQKENDILFMDIMKNMTIFGPKIMAQAFSMNENVLSLVSFESSELPLPAFDKEREFAKQILYLYPYTNSTLQLMVAESTNDDIESVVNLLLTEPELLEEEFATAPGIVKTRLREQFSLEIE